MAREKKSKRTDVKDGEKDSSETLKYKLFPRVMHIAPDSEPVERVAFAVEEYGLEEDVQAVRMAMDVAEGGYRQASGDTYSIMRFDTEIQVEKDNDHLMTLPVEEVKRWAGWKRKARKDAIVSQVEEEAEEQLTEQFQKLIENTTGIRGDIECEVTVGDVSTD